MERTLEDENRHNPEADGMTQPDDYVTVPEEEIEEVVTGSLAKAVKEAGLQRKLRKQDLQRLSKKMTEFAAVGMSATVVRSGPLPAPEEFAKYEEVQEGTADRIIRLTEKEQSHRHEIEERQQSQDFVFSTLGLILGWLSFVTLVGGAMYGGYIGNKWLIVSCLSLAALGAIGQFVKAAIKKKK
ncbi:DUF2335 domain-containing protein [Sneathiella chinensis]|uniref:DUF2335 domain-containing protein n=1 Tax=Sneathiella chinensis TaxID=349750 RepID=UPI00146AE966|nr:DUF2335 domain-containing protein [Sneathiella chinensis]